MRKSFKTWSSCVKTSAFFFEKMDEYVPDKYDSTAPLVLADFGNLQYASAPSVVENIR